MNRAIFLDLDGVLADFDAHFEALFGSHPRDVEDRKMWGLINSVPSFFYDLPLFEHSKLLFDTAKYLYGIDNTYILTACPKSNYQHAAKMKRNWVVKNLSPHVHVLPVMGGKNKCLFMRSPNDVLIDDFKKNLIPWTENFGYAIHHTGCHFKTISHMIEAAKE